MKNRISIVVLAIVSICVTLGLSASKDDDHVTLESIPNVVTTDIKAGIEKHIEQLSQQNNGFFPLEFDGKLMQLKLVRVHMEYLANLGPRRHFACVDLATQDGNVYDVDFFLAGDPGSMTVTETTVHKLNFGTTR
ncbi:MAG TPA: hypothetical protein EYO31_04330 [Phycisphaerales bacterium]|nr:hypothetical protein [Phycisphaerales bacterium]